MAVATVGPLDNSGQSLCDKCAFVSAVREGEAPAKPRIGHDAATHTTAPNAEVPRLWSPRQSRVLHYGKHHRLTVRCARPMMPHRQIEKL